MLNQWQDQVWKEFELLQGIIDRQMTARWQIRAWLLAFQGALIVALFTDKIGKDAFLLAAIAGTAIAWALEMSENFISAKAIERQEKIERALRNNYTSVDPPSEFQLFFICGTLQETAHGWATILYIFSCLGNFRRVLVFLFFITLPVVVRILIA